MNCHITSLCMSTCYKVGVYKWHIGVNHGSLICQLVVEVSIVWPVYLTSLTVSTVKVKLETQAELSQSVLLITMNSLLYRNLLLRQTHWLCPMSVTWQPWLLVGISQYSVQLNSHTLISKILKNSFYRLIVFGFCSSQWKMPSMHFAHTDWLTLDRAAEMPNMVAYEESSCWFLFSLLWVRFLQQSEPVPVACRMSPCKIIIQLARGIYASHARSEMHL